MKQKTINLYSINELSDKAKEKAHNDYLNIGDYYHWGDENKDTLYKFAELFGVKIKDYCYGSCNGSDGVTWRQNNLSDEVLNLRGLRLLRWLQNNIVPYLTAGKFINCGGKYGRSKCQFTITDCPLTGYCMDNSILHPVYEFLKKPTDKKELRDLIGDCFDSWVKDCNSDIESAASMEAFIETSEANEWTYRENGKFEL